MHTPNPFYYTPYEHKLQALIMNNKQTAKPG